MWIWYFISNPTPLPDILPNIRLPGISGASSEHRYWVKKRGLQRRQQKKGKMQKNLQELFWLQLLLETYFVWTCEFLGKGVDIVLGRYIIFHLLIFLKVLFIILDNSSDRNSLCYGALLWSSSKFVRFSLSPSRRVTILARHMSECTHTSLQRADAIS